MFFLRFIPNVFCFNGVKILIGMGTISIPVCSPFPFREGFSSRWFPDLGNGGGSRQIMRG